jgi:phosphohistidine phosphatase SixA
MTEYTLVLVTPGEDARPKGARGPRTDNKLGNKGRQQVSQIAKKLIAAGISPDGLWHATALRALSTAGLLSAAFGNVDNKTTPLPQDWLEMVTPRAHPNIDAFRSEAKIMLVVTHQATVDHLVRELAPDEAVPRIDYAMAVVLKADADNWAGFRNAKATVFSSDLR